ncbi:MAG: hypothetical protein ABJF01_01225 [bacterium]
MSRRHVLVLIASWAAGAGCLSGSSPLPPLPPGGHHVLFIGNSLTYVNDLPGTLAAIAASAGDTIRVATDAGPNLALIDHLTGSTAALAHIREGGWEYVILQQGPTPAGICRDSLVLWTKMFDPYIKAAGARTAVFMAWPYAGPLEWFDEIQLSFQAAAAGVNAVYMPAGEAWRSALQKDPTLTLYGSDGFHPTPTGTFLAALEIYERITGRDARTIPPRAFANGQPLALPEVTVRLLQSAAHDANGRFPASADLAPPRALATHTAIAGHC